MRTLREMAEAYLWIAVVYRGGMIFDTHESDSEAEAVAWVGREHSGAERLEART